MFTPKTITFFLLSLIFLGCKKDPFITPSEIPLTTKGVYVINEGNFGKENSTITFYTPDSAKAYQNIFENVNGKKLGDIGNDMIIYDGKGYIVVNNSQKIEVISLTDNKSVGTLTIPGNKSPYKVAIVNSEKGYVTNLYDNSVTIFNPTTLSIIKEKVPVGNNPQGILFANNKIYVCNSGWGNDSTISIIDIAKDSVVQTLVVGRGPTSLGVDSDGEIIVKCYGFEDYVTPANSIAGNIAVVNPTNNTIVTTIPLPIDVYGNSGKISLSQFGYGYFLTRNGIVKFDTKTHTILSNEKILGSVYSVAIDDATENIYVSDAKDYAQDGEVTIHNKNREKVKSFTTGIIPGTIVFKR